MLGITPMKPKTLVAVIEVVSQNLDEHKIMVKFISCMNF